MKYLLDTDHASILDWPQGSDYAILCLNLSMHGTDEVGISVVSFQEQMLGANSHVSSAKNSKALLRGYELMAGIIDHYRTFPIVPFDHSALEIFDRLKSSRIKIPTMDLRIAAIALANDLTLVTRNRRDFELVEGLRLEDWTK